MLQYVAIGIMTVCVIIISMTYFALSSRYNDLIKVLEIQDFLMEQMDKTLEQQHKLILSQKKEIQNLETKYEQN